MSIISRGTDEQLIMEVQQYRTLYDHSLDDYKDNAKREKLWLLVAKSVGRPAQYCRMRWRHMRDAFKKALHRRRYSLQNGDPSSFRHYRYSDLMSFIIPYLKPKNCSSFMDDEDFDQTEYQAVPHDNAKEFAEETGIQGSALGDVLVSVKQEPVDVAPPTPPDSFSQNPDEETDTPSTSPSPPAKRRKVSVDAESLTLADQECSIYSPRQSMDEVDAFFYSMGQTCKRLPQHLQAKVKMQVFSILHESEMLMFSEDSKSTS